MSTSVLVRSKRVGSLLWCLIVSMANTPSPSNTIIYIYHYLPHNNATQQNSLLPPYTNPMAPSPSFSPLPFSLGGALVNSLKNESCPNCFKFYRWLGVYSNKMNPKFCEKKMLGSALMGASKVISSILTSDSLMTHCILAHSLVLATVL
jgi:hypothetical protein